MPVSTALHTVVLLDVGFEATHKVGGYFQYPVRLDQDDGSDIEQACFLAQKRLVLNPGNDIV